MRQLEAGSGRAADSFDLAPWESLRDGGDRLVGEGAWRPCAGPQATLPQWIVAVEAAESALGHGDPEQARQELAAADGVAACLGQDPDPATLARWHRVRGALGDDTSLALARSLDPQAAWSAAWPTERKAAYDAASPGAPTPVALVAWRRDIRVDGSQPPAALLPGAHLVRSADGAARGLLGVGEEPLQLVLASQVPADGPGALGDARVREDASALLAAVYGPGTRIFVADATSAWAATVGRSDWIALRAVRRSALIPVGTVIGGVGAAAGIAGGALALAAVGDAGSAADAMGAATTPGAFATAADDYDAAAGRVRAFRAIGVGGAAIAVLGGGILVAGLARGEVEMQPTVATDGATLRLVVRR